MSDKNPKTVNKFTRQLDAKLKLLERRQTYLNNLNKGILKGRHVEGEGLKIDPKSRFYSSQIRNTTKEVAKIKGEIDSIYAIVSGKQDVIKFSRVGGWSNPLNKLGIGPYSNQMVFNNFALTNAELKERYPTLHSPNEESVETGGALKILKTIDAQDNKKVIPNVNTSDNKDFKTDDHLDNARNYLLKDRSNERNLKDQLYIKNLQKR